MKLWLVRNRFEDYRKNKEKRREAEKIAGTRDTKLCFVFCFYVLFFFPNVDIGVCEHKLWCERGD